MQHMPTLAAPIYPACLGQELELLLPLGLAGTAGPAKEPRCFKAIPSVVAMEDHSWPNPRGRFSKIFPP